MTMKNSKYWADRIDEIAKIQYEKADEIEKELIHEYEKANKYIQERINLYYARYAKEYGVTLADSKKLLSPEELENYRMTLEEFIEKAKNNENDEWTQLLDEAYLRTRISRLDAIKQEVKHRIIELKEKQLEITKEHLTDVFIETSYMTAYELERMSGLENFAGLNKAAVEKSIYTKWLDGSNFAGRIGNDKTNLIINLDKIITQGLIVGSSSDEMIKKLMKATKVSQRRAANLIQTETTFIVGQANTKMYKEFGVEEYEIVETLDNVTCETCAMMDGKRFKVSEKQEALNAPPFHVRCRGTTVPVSKYEKLWGDSERIARDPVTGENYYTSSKTYAEWKTEIDKKYGDGTLSLEHKKHIRYNKDFEQYNNYKNVLGSKNLPKTIEEFQNLKYTNIDEYDLMKSYYLLYSKGSLPIDLTYDIYKNNLSNKDWQAVGFNPNKLEKHFIKHSDDFEFKTKEEYEEFAKNFMNKDVSETIESFRSDDGYVFKYDIKNNIFADAKPNGITETCYKPTRGLEYWKDQVKKYGKEKM